MQIHANPFYLMLLICNYDKFPIGITLPPVIMEWWFSETWVYLQW